MNKLSNEYYQKSSMHNEINTDFNVAVDRIQMSIYEFYRRYKRGDLTIPVYQRSDVWSALMKSKLIESVLVNIPIPAIFLSENEDYTWEIIDGQQRLRAFFDFLENKYRLNDLPLLAELNGKYFEDLDLKYQRKIEDSQLSVFIIKKESHPDIKFDIFSRINEGSIPLNAQELRNCIFRGEGIELISKLSNDYFFNKMIGNQLEISRLKNQEIVLRFLAFYLQGYEAYRGNLNVFLNDTLRNFEAYKNRVEGIDRLFSDTMMAIYDVFGHKAFLKDENYAKKINIPIFDILSVSFAKYNKDDILRNRAYIFESLKELKHDRIFLLSISRYSSSKSSVQTRFGMWFKVMDGMHKEDNT